MSLSGDFRLALFLAGAASNLVSSLACVLLTAPSGKSIPFLSAASTITQHEAVPYDGCPLLPGSMIRRLSGSAEETDSNDPIEAEPPPNNTRGHAKKKSFTSAKYDVTRSSDTLDRRKVEKVVPRTQFPPNGTNQAAENRQGGSKKQPLLVSGQDIDKMAEPRRWRRSRARSPWSSSILIVTVTALAIVLLLSVVHAFLTRQLDPKGCDMCWSRPIYVKFSDFDTEHTRFASKYSLHLLREGGFDEDPKVGGFEASADLPS